MKKDNSEIKIEKDILEGNEMNLQHQRYLRSKRELRNIGIFVIVLIILQVTLAIGVLKYNSNLNTKLQYDPIYMEETYGEIEYVKQILEQNFYVEFDETYLAKIIIDEMFGYMDDTYSFYSEPKEFSKLKKALGGKPTGLGFKLSHKEDYVVDYVYPNSSAFEQGLQHGDIVIKINDVVLKEFQDNPFKIIPKEIGAVVNLEISRDNEILIKDLEITSFDYDKVMSEKIGNTGYIFMHEFSFGSSKEFRKHLSKLNRSNIDHLIVDLRNNTGGSLRDAAKILGMLGVDGTIVSLVDRHGNTIPYNSSGTGTKTPITVLINKYSASATEIFAYNIVLSERGITLGSTTYGKGVAQNIFESKSGSGVVVTVGECILPDGKSIHGVGVIPTVEIEQDHKNIFPYTNNKETDTQLQEALRLINAK